MIDLGKINRNEPCSKKDCLHFSKSTWAEPFGSTCKTCIRFILNYDNYETLLERINKQNLAIDPDEEKMTNVGLGLQCICGGLYASIGSGQFECKICGKKSR